MGLFVISLIVLAAYLILDWLFHLPKVNSYVLKYVVVTDCGGSTGKRLALHLHALGFNVFACCPDKKGKDVMAEVDSPGLIPALLDVTSEESVGNFLSFVKQQLPEYAGIWALLNNANIRGNTGKTESLTKQDYLKVFDVNLLGTVEMTRTFLPLIRKARGRIVNTSSVYGRLGYQFGPFSASSYGMEAFSDVLRQEVYRQGINISIIEPGSVRGAQGDTPSELNETMKKVGNSDLAPPDRHGEGLASYLKHGFFYFHEHRSSNQSSVIDAYTHAVTAGLPRTRYVIGWDAKFITQSLCFLPDFITDRVIQAGMRASS